MEPIERQFLTLWHLLTQDFGMWSLKTFSLQNAIITFKKIKKRSKKACTILLVVFPMAYELSFMLIMWFYFYVLGWPYQHLESLYCWKAWPKRLPIPKFPPGVNVLPNSVTWRNVLFDNKGSLSGSPGICWLIVCTYRPVADSEEMLFGNFPKSLWTDFGWTILGSCLLFCSAVELLLVLETSVVGSPAPSPWRAECSQTLLW